MRAHLGVALAGVLAAACVTDGPADISGTRMSLTEWEVIPAEQSDLSIPLALGGARLTVEKRIRDNEIVNNRGRFTFTPGDYGYFYSQRITDGWWSDRSLVRYSDLDRVVEAVRANFDSYIGHSEVRPVEHAKVKSVGFQMLVSVNASQARCFHARASYRYGNTHYDNDFGNPDTSLFFTYCAPYVEADEFSDMLRTVTLTEDDKGIAARIGAMDFQPFVESGTGAGGS